MTLGEVEMLYRAWERCPPINETLTMIAAYLGISFAPAPRVEVEDRSISIDTPPDRRHKEILSPEAFGITYVKREKPQFNPLTFNYPGGEVKAS